MTSVRMRAVDEFAIDADEKETRASELHRELDCLEAAIASRSYDAGLLDQHLILSSAGDLDSYHTGIMLAHQWIVREFEIWEAFPFLFIMMPPAYIAAVEDIGPGSQSETVIDHDGSNLIAQQFDPGSLDARAGSDDGHCLAAPVLPPAMHVWAELGSLVTQRESPPCAGAAEAPRWLES